MKTRQKYTGDFIKIRVVREIETGKSLAPRSHARTRFTHPSIVKGKREYFENPENNFSDNGRVYYTKNRKGWRSLKGWSGGCTQRTSY